jgi:hypothetical protein
MTITARITSGTLTEMMIWSSKTPEGIVLSGRRLRITQGFILVQRAEKRTGLPARMLTSAINVTLAPINWNVDIRRKYEVFCV